MRQGGHALLVSCRKRPIRRAAPISVASLLLILPAFLILNSCHEDPVNPFCPHGQWPPYSAPTLIGDLNDFCFSGSVDCECYEVDLLLYLDTGNLPSANMPSDPSAYPHLTLSSKPTTPYAGSDRIGFDFSGTGTLPEEIDPGLIRQSGWKVEIHDATIRYCQSCINDCGLVPVIGLHGSLDNVNFRYDPLDTLAIYIHRMRP